MDIKGILEALNLLKGVDTNDLRTFAADQSLEKALADMKAQDLKAGEDVPDHWREGRMHRAPSRAEVNVGHPQESSGGGLDRMVKEFSNPAPQWPLTTTPEQLAAYLGDLHAALKAQGHSISGLLDGMGALKAVVVALAAPTLAKTATPDKAVKAEAEEDEGDEEEESEVVEINEKACKAKLAKANTLLRKIKTLKAEEKEEEKESEEAKAIRAEIKSLRKSVSKLLGAARKAAYAASSDELKKSIRTIAAKADINVVQEEEEEEEDDEEEGAKKAVEAAPAAVVATTPAATVAVEAKAKTDDAGNQADKQNPVNGNQADSAAKAATLDSALEGKIGMLQGTVNQLFDVITGKSKVADIVPDIAKSAIAKALPVETLLMDIEKARDGGALSDLEAFACEDVVQRLREVKENGANPAIVNDRFVKTTANARQWLSSRLAA